MRYGIRQLKDGSLSRAVHRASQGEEIVVTDHGRPVARIVPYVAPPLPSGVAELCVSGRMELRAPLLGDVSPVTMAEGSKSAVDYVREQRP